MKQHNITYHNVPRETFKSIDSQIANNREKLEEYLNLLGWWNKRINLISRSVSRETLREHIRHSLILSEIPCFQNSKKVVDAGTGGGLPGIPLAIANPQKEFILNDIVGKKVMAVKQMAGKLALSNISTLKGSIDEIDMDKPFYLVSKHAFKIGGLYGMVLHLPWEKLIFYKGLDFENELDGIDQSLHIDVYRLYENSGHLFYKDKAFIILSK